jgi:Penicillin binding protein transpeptidase domain./Transglycosylase.
MKEYLDQLFRKAKPVIAFLKRDKTRMAFRITYSVIWNLFLIFLIAGLLLAAMGAGVGAGYFASLVKEEKPRSYESMKKDIYNYEEPSEVYFAGNELMGNLRSDIVREEVKIDDVSEYFIKAVVAVEDENFFIHHGVVPKAVLRALFQEITNSQTQTGGSTITQQLIKNQILTNEVSFERKAKEILLALRLEKFFSKKEILEAYINVSSFGRNSSGQNIAGVQAAAKGIFGIDAKDLNLPQAAFLAGLPQSPFAYTPFTRDGEQKSEEGMKAGLERQKVVLRRMRETGAITEEEYKEALKYDIVKDFIPPRDTMLEQYPYLTMEVERRAREVLAKMFYEADGYSDEDMENASVLKERYEELADRALRQDGYKIYTTIDKGIYDKFQEVVANYNRYGPDRSEKITDPDTGQTITIKEPMEVGAMMIENATGRIIAFVGGRGTNPYKKNWNYATQAKRPNGSTMKPLLVYGPAIDMGIGSPATVLADVDHGERVDGRAWPQNYSGRYYGLTSARMALAKSYNVSAVNMMDRILAAGKDPFQYPEKMGMESLNSQEWKVRSNALGASSVTVEENTNAFATFANYGKFVDAYMIERIEDKDGKVIYEHKSEPVEVFSPQAAYLTIDMMRDVLNYGTAAGLKGQLKFSADFAGKTGTSQDWKDIWFVGFNPNVTMGIWMGYDTPKTISNSSAHLPLWARLMNAAYDVNPGLVDPDKSFTMPGGIVKRTVSAVSGLIPNDAAVKAGLTLTDYFLSDSVPNETDHSLIEGKYVVIGGKKYLALDSTPDDLSQTGFILNPDFIQSIAPNLKDLNQLIPDSEKWKNVIVPDAKLEDNGKVPAPLKVSLTGSTVQWSRHPEEDIIGYRVYKITGFSKEKIASLPSDGELTLKLHEHGLYAVCAVDIAGNESALSNIVLYGSFLDPGAEKPDEDSGPPHPGDISGEISEN